MDNDEVDRALDEIVKDIRNPNEPAMVRYTLAQTKIAKLQARIAYDTAKSDERLARWLVIATWALVVATLVVAAVAIWVAID